MKARVSISIGEVNVGTVTDQGCDTIQPLISENHKVVVVVVAVVAVVAVVNHIVPDHVVQGGVPDEVLGVDDAPGLDQGDHEVLMLGPM